MPTTRDYLAQILRWIEDNPQSSPNFQHNVALGDAEFGNEVAPYLDPKDRKYLDPKQARFVGVKTPLDLRGLNTIGGQAEEFGIDPKFHPTGQSTLYFEPGSVYALSAQDANPQLWAHEFRHESPNVRWGWRNAPSSETYNRYEDLFHAMTRSDKEDAIMMLADALYVDSMPDESESIKEYDGQMPEGYWMKWAEALYPSIMEQMQKRHER